jgi:hypothetical protein
MNIKHLQSFFTILLLSATGVTQAYTYIGEWADNSIIMRASSVSFPSGNSYRTALGTVTNHIAYNPSQTWIIQYYDDTSIGFDNGQNEIWFSADSSYNPAVTFTWKNWWTGKIDEADVVFYNGEDYTTSMNKTSLWAWGGFYRPFQTTLMHEYGHVMGLGHENDEYNIMGQDWTHIHLNGSTATSYLGEDASDGLVDQYGLYSGGSFEDVSVSMFEYSGSSGEYSTHNLCDVFTTAGAIVSSTSFNGQRRYNVNKGSTYMFEFSYENNGETTQGFRAGYYLSSNNYISTSDRYLGSTNFTLGRDNVYTYQRSITIPSDLTSGSTYYLGVIVDDNNALTEVDNNNAAYHIILVN